ncbi:hypothetical protein VTN49DRAFT_4514 [Thermomyces lanuginosus]|uniref:uncharacterized protein n=1 Tax=Thermomyces lanuginosus TaxID=5541 RepID=UPI003742FF15
MTSDDQFFLDYLALIPNDVRRYSAQVAEAIDRHVDHAANTIRDAISQYFPSILHGSSRNIQRLAPPPPPRSLPERVYDWVLRNRAWTAAIIAFFGTGGLLLLGSKAVNGKKRRVKRAGNGARKEIVVIAGSPLEPMTRSIAADLERRGYIVFIVVQSTEEQQVVEAENRSDIRALYIDIAENPPTPSEIHPSLQGIYSLITQPQHPYPGIPPHVCQLSGLIILPSLEYPTGPVPTIPASSWADAINTRILSPIVIAQMFLPLLTHRNNSSTILFLYPSISSSLSAPYAAPEVTATRALSGFAASLRQELRLLQPSNGSSCNVDVVELRLGNVDLGPQYRSSHSRVPGTDVLAWSPQQRALYGPSYLSSIEQRPVASKGPGAIQGTPARILHHAIFDCLAPAEKTLFGRTKRKKPVVYVGRGARSYGIIGDWLPSTLVGWMLGYRSSSVWNDNGQGSETGWEKV